MTAKISQSPLTWDLLQYTLVNGFRRKRSTVLQTVDILCKWMHDINVPKSTQYKRLEPAFGIVNHRLLVSKLWCFGIFDFLIAWLASFLESHMFAVRLGGITSEWRPAPSGVPPESVLDHH